MRIRVLAAAACLALLLGALGILALWLLQRSAIDHSSEIVPASAIGYVHVFLRPSTKERLDIAHVLEEVFGSDDAADDIKDALEAALKPLLESKDLDYDTHVRPYLGSEFAWFMLPSIADQALLVEAKGNDAADELSETARVLIEDRADLRVATVGTFTAIGTEAALEALRATSDGGESLADSGLVEDLAELSVERVAAMSFDSGAPGERADATVSVRRDGLQIDARSGGAPEAVAEAFAGVPPPLSLVTGVLASLPEAVDERTLAALRLSGVLSDGTPRDSDVLGDGFEATDVVDAERLVALAGTLGLLDSRAIPAGGVTEHLSRMVLGTQRMDGTTTIRIFIGVK